MFGRAIAAILPLLPKGLVGRVAGRYIAGAESQSAIALAGRLQDRGFNTTIDRLGEETASLEQARRESDAYLALMDDMVRAGVERNISLKLTQLGLRIDGEQAFLELQRILEKAAEADFFVRIDMEDATVTDATLEIHHRARQLWPRVGTVLQSRLHRTREDARVLAGAGAHIRLCKGIYPETGAIAYRQGGDIDRSYLDCAGLLLAGPGNLAFATHHGELARSLVELVGSAPRGPGAVEFQALLGVPVGSLLRELRDKGFPVRIYIPYGEDWYGYSLRRLKENPQVAWAITKGLCKRDRLDI